MEPVLFPPSRQRNSIGTERSQSSGLRKEHCTAEGPARTVQKSVWTKRTTKQFEKSSALQCGVTERSLKWPVFQNFLGFPGGSVVENPPASEGDVGSIPGSGRSPGEGNGNPLQYSSLEKPLDREAWQAAVHGVERVGHDFSDHACRHTNVR